MDKACASRVRGDINKAFDLIMRARASEAWWCFSDGTLIRAAVSRRSSRNFVLGIAEQFVLDQSRPSELASYL